MQTMFLPIALCAFATLAMAQSVPDDSYWKSGNVTAHVDVTDTGGPGVDVTVTDASGFSPPVVGTPGDNSTAQRPTARASPRLDTPGEAWKIIGGRLYRQLDNGKWVKAKKVKKPKRSGGGWRLIPWGGDEEVTSMPD
jgi:hypothetical protein